MGRRSRETKNLQGVPVVHGIQGHNHLEYAAEGLVITQEVGEMGVDVLCKHENPEVNIHLSGSCCSVSSLADTCLMKAYKQFALDC